MSPSEEVAQSSCGSLPSSGMRQTPEPRTNKLPEWSTSRPNPRLDTLMMLGMLSLLFGIFKKVTAGAEFEPLLGIAAYTKPRGPSSMAGQATVFWERMIAVSLLRAMGVAQIVDPYLGWAAQ